MTLHPISEGSVSVWNEYTPTWNADTTGTSLGNGTIEGRYTKIGDTIIGSIVLTMGSTTTFGSGFWSFTLPFAARSELVGGSAYGFDASGGLTAPKPGIVTLLEGQTVLRVVSSDVQNVVWQSNQPMAWASGDKVRINFFYED